MFEFAHPHSSHPPRRSPQPPLTSPRNPPRLAAAGSPPQPSHPLPMALPRRVLHLLTTSRGISSTPHLASLGWFGKIKSTFTGEKHDDSPFPPSDSFTLLKFADSMDMARKVGTFKNFVAGRIGEATVAAAFEKHSAVLRYLATIDPTGEKLKSSDKISATKHCNCTITDVEHILAKYTWAKDAQKKIEKLKEEGKPLPNSFSEVQNIMGNTPLDIARSNLAKSGQISRNAPCPCGSKKKYKWCCGAS